MFRIEYNESYFYRSSLKYVKTKSAVRARVFGEFCILTKGDINANI